MWSFIHLLVGQNPQPALLDARLFVAMGGVAEQSPEEEDTNMNPAANIKSTTWMLVPSISVDPKERRQTEEDRQRQRTDKPCLCGIYVSGQTHWWVWALLTWNGETQQWHCWAISHLWRGVSHLLLCSGHCISTWPGHLQSSWLTYISECELGEFWCHCHSSLSSTLHMWWCSRALILA